MQARRGEIVAGLGTGATPVAASATHLVLLENAEAELVVARRDGSAVQRHVLGGSRYDWRALAPAEGGLYLGSRQGLARVSLDALGVDRIAVPFAPSMAAGARVVLLDERGELHVLEGDRLRAAGRPDPHAQLLGSSSTHAFLDGPEGLVSWDLARGTRASRLAMRGRIFPDSFAASDGAITVARPRETAEGPTTEILCLDHELRELARWNWRGSCARLAQTRHLVAALLLHPEARPVLRVRDLVHQRDTEVELSGPVGIGLSRATPDLVAVEDAVVALHACVSVVQRQGAALGVMHFAPEDAPGQWRRATGLLGALAAVDERNRVLALDLAAVAPSAFELETYELARASAGVCATVTSAGVTSLAIAQHPEHGRIHVSQPSEGARLAPGDRIELDEVERAPGGVVRVLRWHRKGAAPHARQRILGAWTLAPEVSLAEAATPSANEPWSPRVSDAARELRDHHRPLATVAARYDQSAAFRRRFDVLGLGLELAWAETLDEISSLLTLEPRRFFVFARHLDASVFYGVDQQTGRLVELTTEDGASEPVPGPADLRELWQERLEFARDAFADDEGVLELAEILGTELGA